MAGSAGVATSVARTFPTTPTTTLDDDRPVIEQPDGAPDRILVRPESVGERLVDEHHAARTLPRLLRRID